MVKLGAKSRLDFKSYWDLRQLCSKNVDILHTHHNSTGSLGRMAILGTGTKIINTEHNDHRFFSHLQKATNSISYPIVDTMVYNSQNTKTSTGLYEKILSVQSKSEVIYNGIDIGRIDDARKSPVEVPDGPVITTVGRLVEQKNHKTLLQAFKLIVNQYPETTLLIVGDGPLYDELRSLSNELGIQDSVVFTGYLPRREDVYNVLKNSTIGVFPSWYEGFCVAAVEAMATGLPVVVSDLDVLHEVVGDPAIFADPSDPVSFEIAIKDLLQSPERRERLGRKAKDRARSTFSLEDTVREYYSVYREMAETSNQ